MKFLAMVVLSLAPARAADLLVAAASDLAPLTSALEHGFTAARVRFTLASSGSLAHQIENGAPFDVYLSANDLYVKELAAKGDVDPATVVVYAYGRLGLWSKDGSVRSLEDLKNPRLKHVAIANPEHAPMALRRGKRSNRADCGTQSSRSWSTGKMCARRCNSPKAEMPKR